MYQDITVLDLCADLPNCAGALACGQWLADMGADVHHWVNADDAAVLASHPMCQAYTEGKAVSTVEWQQNPAQVHAVLDSVDVLIVNISQNALLKFALDAQTLEQRFPHLIVASVTHFGALGRLADMPATDLTATAASGLLYLSGKPGETPVRIAAPQALAHAAADAVVGVQIALVERTQSGAGQFIDASAQQSLTLALLGRTMDAVVGDTAAMRSAWGVTLGEVRVRNQFAARDGEVVILPGILPPLAAFMQRLMNYLHAQGFIDEAHIHHDWGGMAVHFMQGVIKVADWAPIDDAMAAFAAARTKAELMEIAVGERLLIAPVMTVADLLNSDHMRERGAVSGRGAQRRLGAFAQFSHTPLPLRKSTGTAFELRKSAQGRQASAANGTLPLAGVKILDLFWVVAGPGATRMLADYGATVVHVESRKKLDMIRAVPPYVGGQQDPERAAGFHSTNANKLCVSLDLSTDAGREVLADLIRWADVVAESFAPGVLARMGFDATRINALNPHAIVISSCLLGQNGPWHGYAGYGNLAAAVTGFHALTGHEGEPPTGCFGPYTDFTSVRFNAMAILAALRERGRNGIVQSVDMSQSEAALQFLAGECQRFFSTGEVRRPAGNRDSDFVPSGVFPAAGTDCWIAIAVTRETQWQALCDVVAGALAPLRTLDLSERRQREAEIERALQTWCATRDADASAAELLTAGVPAQRVLGTYDLPDNPGLSDRAHFIPVQHPVYGDAWVESSRLRMSRTQARQPERAPAFGSDNGVVLAEILGYSAEQISSLQAQDVLQ